MYVLSSVIQRVSNTTNKVVLLSLHTHTHMQRFRVPCSGPKMCPPHSNARPSSRPVPFTVRSRAQMLVFLRPHSNVAPSPFRRTISQWWLPGHGYTDDLRRRRRRRHDSIRVQSAKRVAERTPHRRTDERPRFNAMHSHAHAYAHVFRAASGQRPNRWSRLHAIHIHLITPSRGRHTTIYYHILAANTMDARWCCCCWWWWCLMMCI